MAPIAKPPRRRRPARFVALAGALIGIFAGQPSIGFLAGAGIGLVLLTLVWLLDRRR